MIVSLNLTTELLIEEAMSLGLLVFMQKSGLNMGHEFSSFVLQPNLVKRGFLFSLNIR